MQYQKTIEALTKLIKTHPEEFKELSLALGLVKFCKRHNISNRSRVTKLPDTPETFGYFTINKCNEVGGVIQLVKDEKDEYDNPLEILPESLIIE